ncbi:hypothetical protein ACNKHW_05125 [Shigella flexneri]
MQRVNFRELCSLHSGIVLPGVLPFFSFKWRFVFKNVMHHVQDHLHGYWSLRGILPLRRPRYRHFPLQKLKPA